MFKDELFCSKLGAPIDLNHDVHWLLNELIKMKKGSGRYVHVCDDNIINDNYNHLIKVTRYYCAPNFRDLAKSVNKMMLDSSDKSSRASNVIKSLEIEYPT